MNEFMKLDVFTSGETLRPVGISQAPGEEPRIARSTTTLVDDGYKPECVRIGKSGLRLSKKKDKVRIATWNVRSMGLGKLKMITSEAKRYDLKVLGIAEHRWAREGHFRPQDGGMMIYSGGKSAGMCGVGFYLSSDMEKALMGYNPVNERIVLVRIRSRQRNLTIIQVYAPTTQADDEEIEAFYEKLQVTIEKVNKRDVIVIMGDFNAKIGENLGRLYSNAIGPYGLGERNSRGDRLEDFAVENDLVIANTLFQQPKRRLYTWTSPDGNTRNQIDFILIKRKWRTSVLNVKTFPGADCDTDHELLSTSIRLKVVKQKADHRPIRFDFEAVDSGYSVEVRNRFANLLQDIDEEQPGAIANRAREILLTAADKHLRRKKGKRQHWISDQTLEKIEERRKLKGKSDLISRHKYKQLNKEIRSLCRADKTKYIITKCNNIQKHQLNNNARAMFQEVNSIARTFQPQQRVIKDKLGNVLTENEQIRSRWKEYCEDIYKCNGGEEEEEVHIEDLEEGREPLREEVEWAIKNLKDGKAPGCDGLTAEMIKLSGKEGIDVYHHLCRKIWHEGKWPLDWKRAVFIPLPKKGDLKECANYRTIALISHASKILLKIIQKRIEWKVEQEVSAAQAGFRRKSGTRDQMFNLKLIIQKCREFNVDLYVCFIDYSKAFDCVSHSKLWETLRDMGFPSNEVNLIKELYKGQQSAVRTICGTTEWFSVKRGVRQGCILSPYLFNIYTESIMRAVEDEGVNNHFRECNIHGHKVSNLRFADDTVLLSHTNEGLQNLVTSVKTHSERKHLMLNSKKTKVMKTDKTIGPVDIKVDNEMLESVNKYEYLGSTVTDNCDGKIEIRRRLAIATNKLLSMTSLWRGEAAQTKLKILRACIFNIATYGCETWTMTNAVSKLIDSFEMKCYRRILRVKWTDHRTNEWIRNELEVKENWLRSYVLRQKLKYFGHLKRHDGMGRIIMEGRVNGKRKRGRPRRQWERDIEDVLKMSIIEAGRLANKRDEFRTAVRGATSTPG